jgi:hypothetical protein
MQAKVFQTDYFDFDGRGETLVRWICDVDILFAEPDGANAFVALSGDICGAQYHDGWVLFHGLQVLQIAPEEVHSYSNARKAHIHLWVGDVRMKLWKS